MMMANRKGSNQSYNKAQSVFNKTKDNYLQQMKKEQEKRYEQINMVHKTSHSLLS